MKKAIGVFAVLFLLGSTAAVTLAAGESGPKAGHAYVGSKKCKGCHKDIFEKMQTTKMWRSLGTLGSDKAKGLNKSAATDPKCVKCHVTGFGDGGFDPALKTQDKKEVEKNEDLAFVGCEACHGPGGDYLKLMTKAMPVGSGKLNADEAVKAGMIVPDEKVCKKCHNKESPFFKEFDFKKFYQEIEHKMKKKE